MTANERDEGRTPAAGRGRGAALPRGWVTSRVRGIEPWALSALAFSMAAAAVLLWPGLPASWGLALVPLLAARWAQAAPARHHSVLAVRAMLVIAGVLLLQLHEPADGGPALSLAQAWLAAACAAYAFLLPLRWTAAVFGLAVLVLGAVGLRSVDAPFVPDAALQAGVALALPTLLAALAGGSVRRAAARREATRIDAATGLFSAEGLSAHGNELLARDRRRGRPVSLVVFDCTDLLEVRRIYGPTVARSLTHSMAVKLARVAGGRGLAARTGAAEFALLLPGMSQREALRAVQLTLGFPICVECEPGLDDLVLLPEVLVLKAEEDEVAEVCEQARRKLAESRRQEQRRRLYLRMRRERHSQPVALALQEAQGVRERALAPTRPMPIAAHS